MQLAVGPAWPCKEAGRAVCRGSAQNNACGRARTWRRRVTAPVTCQAVVAPSGFWAPSYGTGKTPSTVAVPPAVADLSCELLQGNLVRFSTAPQNSVPTAVLVHGILGSRRNLHSFARMILQGFPSWQVLLVDLRCHGDSAAAAGAPAAPGPHTVDSAAQDVLQALRRRRLFPHMLIGHSFGGKVVMSMAQQFAAANAAANGGGGTALPRPVQVWVLDAPPGEARAGGGGGPGTGGGGGGGADSPAQLIESLRRLQLPVASRADVIDHLVAHGFSLPVARWMTTNLKPVDGAAPLSSSTSSGDSSGGLTWAFDLDGIAEMYQSYESSSLWDLLAAPPQGLRVDFVKATRSAFSWGAGSEDRIAELGHGVRAIDSGHWVHSEKPQDLFEILAPSFGAVDLHLQRAAQSHR